MNIIKNKVSLFTGLVGVLIALACVSMAKSTTEIESNSSNSAVAVVNNVVISQDEYRTLVDARKTYLMGQNGVGENGVEDLPLSLKQKLVDDLVLAEILAQEANKRGVDKLPHLLAEAAIQYKTLLGQTLIQEELAAMNISEEEIRQHYDAMPIKYKYGIRHIKVKSKEEANKILNELKQGADFTQLAEQYSNDLSVHKKGWLGYLRVSQMGSALSSAAQSLEPGTFYSQPIQTGAAWRLIYLEGKQALDKTPYSRAKDWMLNEIQQSRVQNMLAELRQKAHVEIYVP